jgi:hypothetical protein
MTGIVALWIVTFLGKFAWALLVTMGLIVGIALAMVGIMAHFVGGPPR